MTERRIFTGTSHFPTLRENRTVYVDKTAIIHRMVRCHIIRVIINKHRFLGLDAKAL